MKSLNAWLAEYGESHQNVLNQRIHKVCVPLIVFSLLGMLWCLPIPMFSPPNPWVNIASVFMLLCMIFYATLGIRASAVMLVYGAICLGACYGISQHTDVPLLPLCVGIFVAAWIGQFVGHKIEGKKPSFMKDLQFLLIGPLWVMRPLLVK